MATLKTRKTLTSVTAFLEAIEDDTRRADAKALAKLMKEATGEKPVLWGTSIVGFGIHASSTGTGDWPVVAFSPRKTSLVVYLAPGMAKIAALLPKLGKHKTGKGCLYVGRLADVDTKVLREIVARSVEAVAASRPGTAGKKAPRRASGS